MLFVREKFIFWEKLKFYAFFSEKYKIIFRENFVSCMKTLLLLLRFFLMFMYFLLLHFIIYLQKLFYIENYFVVAATALVFVVVYAKLCVIIKLENL